MLNIILKEMLRQNQIYHLIKHFTLFFAFALISTILIFPAQSDDITKLLVLFIYGPIFLLSNNYILLKSDFEDGHLELQLTSKGGWYISLTKFIATNLNIALCTAIILPLIMIFLSLENQAILVFIYSLLMILLLSVSFALLIGSVQLYFKYNASFLTVIIMPLILPSLILAGLSVLNPYDLTILALIFGVNLIFIPLNLYLTQYLVSNIYNI